VRDDVKHRSGPVLLLEQPRDGDLALRQLVGDVREHTRPVLDREAEEEGRAALAVGEPRQLAPACVVL
jgi:hypothetical protein